MSNHVFLPNQTLAGRVTLVLDFSGIRALLDWVHEKGAESLEIAALFERVRVLCQNLDFVKMHKSVEKEIDPVRKRYSQGLNMGYLGYYEPSELRVQMAANMRRGRLLRKTGNNTDYTYAYDKSGNLLQIYGPGKPFETLCYSENDTKAFVTFDACYTIWDNPGILCTTFAKYDPAGDPETILVASWMSRYDKKNRNPEVVQVDMDIYQPPENNVQKCCLATLFRHGADLESCLKNKSARIIDRVTVFYGERGKIVNWDWKREPIVWEDIHG